MADKSSNDPTGPGFGPFTVRLQQLLLWKQQLMMPSAQNKENKGGRR